MKPKQKNQSKKNILATSAPYLGIFRNCISCRRQVAVAVVFHSLYTPLKGGYQACLFKQCQTEKRPVSHQTLW